MQGMKRTARKYPPKRRKQARRPAHRAVAGQVKEIYAACMGDLGKQLRDILGPILDLPAFTDGEAVQFIMELKAIPNPSPSTVAWIKNLEDAWHRAAAPDMTKKR